MIYRTELIGTKNGHGTFAIVSRYNAGTKRYGWTRIGTTRTYWTASQLTRARSNAETIAKLYHKEHYPQLPITLTKA